MTAYAKNEPAVPKTVENLFEPPAHLAEWLCAGHQEKVAFETELEGRDTNELWLCAGHQEKVALLTEGVRELREANPEKEARWDKAILRSCEVEGF